MEIQNDKENSVFGYLSLTLILGELVTFFNLANASSPAFRPDNNIDPKVGPIRGNPKVSVTDIPAAINPG